MNFRFIVGILVFISIIFSSCEANIDLNNVSKQISIHPDLVVPIGGANVNLGQVLANYISDSTFSVGGKEINYQVFDTIAYSLRNVNLLKNVGELDQTIIPSPFNSVLLPPSTSFPTVFSTGNFDLGLNSNPGLERIDSVRVASASFGIQVNVTPDLANIKPSDIKLTLTFPNRQIRNLNGTPASITFTPVNYGQTGTVVLSNFLIDMSGLKSGIPIQASLDLKTNSLAQPLDPNSKITYKISINQLTYTVAFGFFGRELTTTQINSQKIDFNKLLPNSLLKFTNPQVDITANTNLGANIQFQIDYIKAYLTTDNTFNPVYALFNGSKTTNIVFDSKPVIPGVWVSKKLPTFDKNWGGTDKLFDNTVTPDMLEYKFSTSVDSLTKSNSPDFITPDASMKVYTKITIPLQLNSGSYYELKDTINNSLESIATSFNTLSNVDSTYLILNITNRFPIKTTFSFAFTDLLGNELKTNFEKSYIINAGKVDADGSVLPNQETQTLTISLAKEQISTLRQAKKIVFSVRIDGENVNSKIHFSTSNTFDLKAGLFVMGGLNVNLFSNLKK